MHTTPCVEKISNMKMRLLYKKLPKNILPINEAGEGLKDCVVYAFFKSSGSGKYQDFY